MLRYRIIILLLILLICGCAPKSDNEGAISYRNGKCYAFYPEGNRAAEEYAKSLCEDEKEKIFDYSMEKSGDFLVLSYVTGRKFYLEDDLSDPNLEVKDRPDILGDMLRYEMKKDDLDRAYTSKFMLETAADTLDLSGVRAIIGDDDMLHLYFPQFDYDLKVPFCYAQQIVGKDFNVPERTYLKQYYINPNRPMVAVTYDDGPYRPVDSVIYETMAKYDAHCTFDIVGDRLSPNNLESVRQGIELGHEFGSHTENHQDLSQYTAEEARNYVLMVNDYVEKKLGYRIKTYRPPYGERNLEMEAIIDMPSIMWNVDSKDWSNRDRNITYDNIMAKVSDHDVILMHSLYTSTAHATEKLVPDLIDMGYQLVTVSELMEHLGIKDKTFSGQ